ncbi:hypothetical protein, partial [Ochrobactrum sp. 3-3]
YADNMETTARPTIDQKIARKEAELARLRQQGRALETGQKIVLGGLLLNAARNDPAIRKWLIAELPSAVTREVDRKRLAPIVAELVKLDG